MTEQTTVQFGDLGDVTAVILTDNLSEEILRTEDPRRISVLAGWLADRTDGWEEPEGGVRVAGHRLNLMAGEEPRGHLGLALRVLIAHHDGGFAQRPWTAHERRELFDLLGAADPLTVGL